MAKEKLENLSIDELMKRKKFASFILGILIGMLLLVVTIMILGISQQKAIDILVPVALFLTGFPMFQRLKKINEEIRNRENK